LHTGEHLHGPYESESSELIAGTQPQIKIEPPAVGAGSKADFGPEVKEYLQGKIKIVFDADIARGNKERIVAAPIEIRISESATGSEVTSVEPGRRYLVQADWRDLKTAKSNGAFGYNFEGGLQQYVLIDEVVVNPAK